MHQSLCQRIIRMRSENFEKIAENFFLVLCAVKFHCGAVHICHTHQAHAMADFFRMIPEIFIKILYARSCQFIQICLCFGKILFPEGNGAVFKQGAIPGFAFFQSLLCLSAMACLFFHNQPTEENPRSSQYPEKKITKQKTGRMLCVNSFQGSDRHSNTDPAPNSTDFVILIIVTFSASFFHIKGADQTHVFFSVNLLQRGNLFFPVSESLQCPCLPFIGPVVFIYGRKAGNMRSNAVSVFAHLMHLTGHIRGIHQRQFFARWRDKISFRNI